jgi:phage repressor protein C with HTH and peptisase S24 domain
MQNLGDRIQIVLRIRGITQSELARQTNLTRSTINGWINGRTKSLSGDHLMRVAEAMDIYPRWLASGDGPITPYHRRVGEHIANARNEKGWTQGELVKKLESVSDSSRIKLAGIHAIEAGKRAIIEPDLDVYAQALDVSFDSLNAKSTNGVEEATSSYQVSYSRDEVTIPKLSAIASMGDGVPDNVEHDSVVSRVSVSKRWIRENLSAISSTNNLAMITGHGDSMAGTFNNGDVLFVDTGVSEVKMDAVYVFNVNDELYIKRLQRVPDGSFLMISDNKHYEPQSITPRDKLAVLGQIVGIWNFRRI